MLRGVEGEKVHGDGVRATAEAVDLPCGSDLLGFRKHALLTAVSRFLGGGVLARSGPGLPGAVATAAGLLLASLDVLPPLLEVALDVEDIVDGLGQERVDLGLDVRIRLVIVLGELDLGDLEVHLGDQVTEAFFGGPGDVVVLLSGLLRFLDGGLAGGAGLLRL